MNIVIGIIGISAFLIVWICFGAVIKFLAAVMSVEMEIDLTNEDEILN